MIDQMKTTDLYTGEQGERFVTGTDDSGTSTAKDGSRTVTVSKSEEFH